MSKAILVIDMPESCNECNLCYYSDGRVQLCYWKDKVIDKVKPEWCPLKPAPEEQLVWHNDDEWIRGYNNCVREIMGREDYE